MTTASVWNRDATVRYIAIIGALSAAGLLIAYGAGLHGGWPLPVDRHDVPLGRDFLNTWFYGRAFFDAEPERFYNRRFYVETVHAMFPQDAADRLWSYPPAFLMVAAPFGCLPYPWALAAWTAVGLAVLGLAVRSRGSAWLTAAVLTAPMVIYSLIAGQVSLFIAAILLTVFAQLDRRPILAGLLLSLLVIKPQTAVLVPLLLIVTRRWTALLAAAAGVVALVAFSMAVNGFDAWAVYLNEGVPEQAAEMKATLDVLAPISASLTTAGTRAGLPATAVSALQTVGALVAVACVLWIGRYRFSSQTTPIVSSDYEGLVVLTCSIFASPYLLFHDLAAFSAMVLILAYREGLVRNRFLLLMILYAPLLQSALGALHLYILPLLAMGFAAWLVLRLPLRAEAPPSTAGSDWAGSAA